jgi:uncharacterized repeat protein (TIGR01451 family)/LPXTG-motif cell wall-anchored protein
LIPVAPAAAAGDTPGTLPATDAPVQPPAPKPPVKAPVKPVKPVVVVDTADVSVKVTGVKVAIGGKAKTATITVTNNTPKSWARTVSVDIQATSNDDPSQLDGPNPIGAADKACKSDGQKVGHFTCTLGSIAGGQKRDLQFVYGTKPVNDPKLPVTVHPNAATITAAVSATSVDPTPKNNAATGVVDITPSGADLAVNVPDTSVALPGGTATTLSQISNLGTSDASGVLASFKAPSGTTFKSVALKATDGTFSVPCKLTSKVGATCTIGALQADHFVTAQIVLNVSPSVPSAVTLAGGVGAVFGSSTAAMRAQLQAPKTSSKVQQRSISSSAAPSTSEDPSDNSDTYGVPISDLLKADLGVTATKVTSKLNSAGTFTVKLTNHGPYTAKDVYVDVTIPENTGYAAVSAVCKHIDPQPVTLRCTYASTLASGKSVTFPIKIQTHDTAPGTGGKVVVHGKVADTVAKNNSAALTVTVPTADNASNTSNTGTLPVTGSQTGLFAAVGGILVLLGGAITLVTRRRRTTV